MSTGHPKILCLTSYDLDGPDSGAVLRSRHVFQHLRRFGDVSVVVAGDGVDESLKRKTLTGGFRLVDVVTFQPTRPWSMSDRVRNELDTTFLNTDRLLARVEDRERLRKQIAAHDLVWIYTLKLANRFALWRWPCSVLDIDDIPSSLDATKMAAASGAGEKLCYWRQSILWRRRESRLLDRFDAVCVSSEPDRERLGGDPRVFVVRNGASGTTEPRPRPLRMSPRIGFVGGLQHFPNRHGLQWFIEEVWPQILDGNPQARLRLVGADTQNQRWQAVRNVEALGWVDDLHSEMATWALSVVPVRIGAGTRVKIAEAFSQKCPVVSTSLGAYGYEVTDGRELWLADSPATFASQCLRALDDPREAAAVAERAWQKFLHNWTWDAQASRVAAVVETVLKTKRYEASAGETPAKSLR